MREGRQPFGTHSHDEKTYLYAVHFFLHLTCTAALLVNARGGGVEWVHSSVKLKALKNWVRKGVQGTHATFIRFMLQKLKAHKYIMDPVDDDDEKKKAKAPF